MSKEALKLAFEAVDKAYDELARAIRDKTSPDDAYIEIGMAHHYLKQALAKQEQSVSVGEPVAYDVRCDNCGGDGYDPKDNNYSCSSCEGSGFLEKLLYTTPQPVTKSHKRKRILFPTMLRKMWSGGEVQAWIDEHVNKDAA